jgi:hypothetical protein
MPADAKPTSTITRRLSDDAQAARPFALRAMNDGAVSSMAAPTFGPIPASMPGVGLTAALVSVQHDTPTVLTASVAGQDMLPSATFQMPGQTPGQMASQTSGHPTLESCLRDGVAAQTGLTIGYVEQLLAFADRSAGLGIGYLALTRAQPLTPTGTTWRSWYDFLPWEDWRNGRPSILSSVVEPHLRAWAETPAATDAPPHDLSRADRVRMAFGLDRAPWNEERVAERYELVVEAGLLDRLERPDRAMRHDHVRVLANGIGALRAKLKTRPVVFELMEPEFTLFELQKTVEAILGPHLHKQNFRRLVESAGLVEPTGEVRAKTGGRPAKLFRFRQVVLMERPAPGVRVHAQRG